MKQLWNKLADKQKPLFLFGLAVVAALGVTVLIHGQLQQVTQSQAQARETQSVVVAAVDLPWGTSITSSMIKTMPYLKESLPAGSFSDPAVLVGRTTIFPMKANEPLFESKLAPTSVATGGVAALVTPKKRAMGVKVDKVVGVSGFIHPGNRVDVLVTLSGTDKVHVPTTKIVLENILVLATGTELEKSGKQEKPAQVDVITLEVTPEEGEKLALAATEGKLQLALRNFSDSANSETHGTTIPGLLAQALPPKPVAKKAAAAPKPASSTGFTVETIRGSKVTETNFKKGE
ncbi:MAG TPA: Flp pilus assembly protein CpaB [Syntrophales bacterium]|nr:Flp pilus assembly protein CpaB [Syntrophales bacterium]